MQLAPLQRQVNQSLSHLKTIQYYINNQGENIAYQVIQPSKLDLYIFNSCLDWDTNLSLQLYKLVLHYQCKCKSRLESLYYLISSYSGLYCFSCPYCLEYLTCSICLGIVILTYRSQDPDSNPSPHFYLFKTVHLFLFTLLHNIIIITSSLLL